MFEPYRTLSFGPLSLSMDLLFLLAAVIVAFFSIERYMKWLNLDQSEQISDQLTWALFGAVAIFKFWPVITAPSLLSNPMNALYFTGGPFALEAAMLFAFGWMAVFAIIRKWPLQLWEAVIGGAAAGSIIYFAGVRNLGAVSPLSVGFNVDGVLLHPLNFYMLVLVILAGSGRFIYWGKEAGYKPIYYYIGSALAIWILISPFRI